MNNHFAILIPTYNEAGNIIRTADAINRQLTADSLQADIIFINDGSRDSSQEEIQEASSRYPNVVGLKHETNKGYGEAIRTGISFATTHNEYSFVFIMDADLTMDPKFIKGFYTKISAGFDFVIGSRYTEGGALKGVPFYRRVVSRLASVVSHCCFRLPIRDYTLGFRAIRVPLLKKLDLTEKGFPILIEQVYQSLQFTDRFAGVPIILTNREIGESTFSFSPEVFLKYFKYALKALWTHRARP